MRQAILSTTLSLVLASLLAGCTGSDGGAADGETGDGTTDGEGALAPEAGVLSGTLSVVGSSTTQPIGIRAAGHPRLAVTLVLTSSVPQTSIGLNVSGPDGRSDEVRTGPTLFVLPGGKPSMSFGDPAVGDWMASVELRSGARAEYEVHWCADDAEAVGPQDNLACRRG